MRLEPVIKVRHKPKTMLLLLLLHAAVTGAVFLTCDKTPDDTGVPSTVGTGGYEITLIGKPELYRPNQNYTIKVKVIKDLLFELQ